MLVILKIVIIVGIILFLLNILYFTIYGIRLTKYKPFEINIQEDELPFCSIIIPVFNQGEHIKTTLDSLKNIDYPIEKYQIIVVNDGSTDNTIEYIQSAIKENNKIKLIDLKLNKGKRTALYNGILEAKGDYFITLDSDSIIQKETIKQIIKPFLIDPTVGAVAGNILIDNDNFIPRMLSSAFNFGFEFVRTAQSIMGIVMCTPGALSAYRKNAFKEKQLLNWTKQLFFFKRASIGQDRALTNIILMNNYKIVYQRTAIGSTIVPTTYSKLCKMFMRWIRGDIRQNFFLFIPMCKNIFKDTVYDKLGLWFNYIMMTIWLVSPFIMLIYFLFSLYLGIFWYCLYTFVFTIFWSTLPAVYYMKQKRRYSIWYTYIFGFLNLCTLIWLIPYCWFTINKSGWLTR